MTPRTFTTAGTVLDSGEFWYSDETAWDRWLDQIDNAISEEDPWALLVMRPDTDVVIVDVCDGWRDRIKRFNGRAVQLIQPVDRP